jgi:hypothetical protein
VKKLAQYWQSIQKSLFPQFEQEVGETTPPLRRLIVVLDVVEIERYVYDPALPRGRGRPAKARSALARAFVAKAVLGLTTTRALRERLLSDPPLRRICGFEGLRQVPSESVFSTAFAEFCRQRLPEVVHETLIKESLGDTLVFHVSRDSTDIPARVTVAPAAKPERKPRKRGRPKKGEVRMPERRLERQLIQTLPEMLEELPQAADCGSKRGYSWKGYKLHLDVSDGGIPLTALLTSASLHDSQAAIPLEKMTAQRVKSLYSLMDSAYDAKEIRKVVEGEDKVALISPHNRQGQTNWLTPAQQQRFRERSTVERTYARLKDDFGARHVRVRGAAKVMAHLMFGVLALTAEQLVRVLT